jgi:hypothetical protein
VFKNLLRSLPYLTGILLIATCFIFIPEYLKAAPPFEEYETFNSYEGGIPDNWEVYKFTCSEAGCIPVSIIENYDGTNAEWVVNNGKYGIHITSQPVLTFTQTLPSLWPPTLSNYSISFDMYLVGSINYDRNFVIRHTISDNWYRWYEIHIYGNKITLQKADTINGGGAIESYTGSAFNHSVGGKYHFETQVVNKNIKVYVDDIEIFNYTDESDYPILQGKAGFQSGVHANGGDVEFDNFLVKNLDPSPTEIPTETPTPTPTPTATLIETPTPTPTESPFPYINVPDIKQFSTPWSSQEYDQATKWSLKPTIERWGCALTSAAMILRNFNHKVFPDFLNNWLKSQSDGYIRNGLINWLAVSRFSKTNTQKIDENLDLPTLSYERVETSDKSKIEEILNQNIPTYN